MDGKYGPVTYAETGEYAYLYFEIGGGELENDQVVSMWASIWDPVGGAVTQVETAECVVIYESKVTGEEAAELDVDVTEYATDDMIGVRSY